MPLSEPVCVCGRQCPEDREWPGVRGQWRPAPCLPLRLVQEARSRAGAGVAEMTPFWPGLGPQTLDSGVHLDPQTQAWRPGYQFAGLMGKADPSAMLTELPGRRELCVPQAWPHPRLHCPSPPARLAWPGGPRGCSAPGPCIRASHEVASVPGSLAVGSRGLVAKPSRRKPQTHVCPATFMGTRCASSSHPRKWGCRASQAAPRPRNFRSHTGPLVRTPRMRAPGSHGGQSRLRASGAGSPGRAWCSQLRTCPRSACAWRTSAKGLRLQSAVRWACRPGSLCVTPREGRFGWFVVGPGLGDNRAVQGELVEGHTGSARGDRGRENLPGPGSSVPG